jgi:hypothetical protein
MQRRVKSLSIRQQDYLRFLARNYAIQPVRLTIVNAPLSPKYSSKSVSLRVDASTKKILASEGNSVSETMRALIQRDLRKGGPLSILEG